MFCTEPYKEYVGYYDYSEEDQCVHGRLLYIVDLISFEADDYEGVQASFEAAVDHYLQTCAELGDVPNNPIRNGFHKIEDAPRDGTHIYVIRPHDLMRFEAWFDPEGFSRIGIRLEKTGTWNCEAGGWFEKGEVQFWVPKD